jgi:hypothetical protein
MTIYEISGKELKTETRNEVLRILGNYATHASEDSIFVAHYGFGHSHRFFVAEDHVEWSCLLPRGFDRCIAENPELPEGFEYGRVSGIGRGAYCEFCNR